MSDHLSSNLPYLAWRGPWILAVFPDQSDKEAFLDAKVEIFFGSVCRVFGSVRDLLSDTFNQPDKLMLDIVETRPTPANRPTSIKIDTNGVKSEVPVWHDKNVARA